MSVVVKRIEKDVWVSSFSEHAHKAVFEELKPKEWDRIDYALITVNEQDEPTCYMTCREFSHDTVYWQYGGSFPNVRGTVGSYVGYTAFRDWHKERYARVVTYIENTNSKMLKMAASIGFIITGVRNYKGEVLLEHLLEFKNEN